MSILDGVGLQFKESMSGHIGTGETDPHRGAEKGKNEGTEYRFDVQIKIPDLNPFLKISDHKAELSGTVTCKPLGGPYPIRDGIFKLFSLDPETGIRQMIYAFKFSDDSGQTYFLYGHKDLYDDPGLFDSLKDITSLFTVIYRGPNNQAPIYGAGELCFKLSDTPSLLASMKVIGATSWRQKTAAYLAFSSFIYSALREVYLKDLRFFYNTQYENLVLSGAVQSDEGLRPFFLVSGVHDKGFPWGDGETFWDVLLAIGDGNGDYNRYCISDRVLEGLNLDVEHGKYRYRGPLMAVKKGYKASFKKMQTGGPGLARCQADFEISFNAQPYSTQSFPYSVSNKLLRRLRKIVGPVAKKFRDELPSAIPPGIHITPHTVVVNTGKLSIKFEDKEGDSTTVSQELQIDTDRTFGEAERSSFRNIKEPTLLYGYICAVRPDSRAARVQIHSSTLRNEREDWVKDQFDKFVGSIASRIASEEILIEDDRLSARTLGRQGEEAAKGGLFVKLGEPVLEVNNDHFPTAIFQRRIVKVRDPSGEECLALEEDMNLMRLEPINSDKKIKVVAIKNDESKFAALDEALEKTKFNALLEKQRVATGKTKADFSIVIKPNFMFSYNKRDRTTFTDPELVGHLVKRIRKAGFIKISVVEAQSALGDYFDKRSVPEMAQYLGFDGSAGYQVIDMTEDADESQYLGPHLGLHPVSRVWRNADFRISFAKNKTHAYAYYTLTLKNIYGALPLGSKFKEYHCRRGIYHTTIEYLTAFPVHFGLVDAYHSADGPFGVFADTAAQPDQHDNRRCGSGGGGLGCGHKDGHRSHDQ